MQTITINAETIAALEANGWKRWTKNGKDRMYLNSIPTLEVEHYNTGNVRSAEFDGKTISNADARRLMASKVYIDLATGELNVTTDYYRNPRYNADDRNLADVVAEHVAAILATVEEHEATEEPAQAGCPELSAEVNATLANLGYTYTESNATGTVHAFANAAGDKVGVCVKSATIVRTIVNKGGNGHIIDGWDAGKLATIA